MMQNSFGEAHFFPITSHDLVMGTESAQARWARLLPIPSVNLERPVCDDKGF